jgi:hypothetical protein
MSGKAMDLLNNKKVLSVACIVSVLVSGYFLHFLGFWLSKIAGVSGIMFGLFSAIWFIYGLLMSDEEIDAITLITEQTPGKITIPTQNIKARDSLKDNRENAKIGIIFLLLAFLSQSLGLLIA